LPPYHCSAQPSPGLRITLFSPQSLLRSGPSPLSAPQAQGIGADMDKDYLTLKRVPTRASVEDYDVLCRGEVVGRIFLSQAGKWMWASNDHEGRAPAYGDEATRQAALQALARAWGQNEGGDSKVEGLC